MFENWADDLSNLLEEKEIIKPENREFYFYGLRLAFNKLLFFIVILIISLFTKTFLVSMASRMNPPNYKHDHYLP